MSTLSTIWSFQFSLHTCFKSINKTMMVLAAISHKLDGVIRTFNLCGIFESINLQIFYDDIHIQLFSNLCLLISKTHF